MIGPGAGTYCNLTIDPIVIKAGEDSASMLPNKLIDRIRVDIINIWIKFIK